MRCTSELLTLSSLHPGRPQEVTERSDNTEDKLMILWFADDMTVLVKSDKELMPTITEMKTTHTVTLLYKY